MKLEPGEHAVLGYFHDETGASKAVTVLVENGFIDITIDNISRLPRWRTSTASSLSSLVLDTHPDKRQYAPLLNADHAVSGLSMGRIPTGAANIVVTVITKTHRAGEAARIMRSVK
ncbi:hypothetical protein ACU70A_06060 [Syntrophomonas erecta subsp. sporosyntropha]